MAVIWVVEDDSVVAQLVGELLRANGYEMVWFPGGGEVIEALQKHSQPPDLMILDIKMPPPDGNDVLEFMRNRDQPPVVVLSAYPDCIRPELRSVYKAALTKPPTYLDLLATVREAIAASKQQVSGGGT